MPDRITTDSGIPVKTSYDNRDVSRGMVRSLGKPGEFPYARGIYPSMYRDRLWTMRQYTGFGSASETNRRFKYLISHGETGLSTAFDLPTQLGLDSDHPRAHGEVGKVGVAISSIDDMRRLFDGIDLGKISTSMTINSTAPILLCLYAAAGLEQRVPQRQLRGTTQNDILKEYIARNTYIYPPEFSLRLAVDLIEYSARKMPHWHPISISGYHIRESGADAIQELAFCFSNAIEYVEAALARGLKIDDFAPQLSFFFACRNDFLEEIAKFRAARKIWASIMRRRFKAHDPESCKLRFHAQTSVATLIDRVQQLGGARKAIESGFVHRQIQESAYKFQRSVDEGQTVIVGVNRFKEGDQKEVTIQRISPRMERRQIQQLRNFKNARNKAKVKSALSRLGNAASGDSNLVEDILRAVRSECTVGEISDIFRNKFGEYRVRLEI